MLFPFAREIVATATRNGGFLPLLLEPIDFANLYRQRLAAAQTSQASRPANPN
jgi:preprotein translocase subunit SecB